jgi:hypothetical protein
MCMYTNSACLQQAETFKMHGGLFAGDDTPENVNFLWLIEFGMMNNWAGVSSSAWIWHWITDMMATQHFKI